MQRLSFVQSVFWLFLLLKGLPTLAQNHLQWQLPEQPNWNVVEEGSTLRIPIRLTQAAGAARPLSAATSRPDTLAARAVLAPAEHPTFGIVEGKQEGMTLDSTGVLAWTPPYHIVGRLDGSKVFNLTLEAALGGERTTQPLEIRVVHTNRPPVVNDLKPFYVQYNVQNSYQMDLNSIRDEDGDPLVFVAIPDQMPEGARLSAQGELLWKPSQTQFNALKNRPLYMEFWVEDQPTKARTRGRLKVEVTQMDLGPELSMVPGLRYLRIREDATLNLAFYLSDPNGDDDIDSFGFVSDNPVVPKTALKRNTRTQYEFIWKPGFDFVKDPLDSVSFNLTFFVLDKTQRREERRLSVTVQNTVNEREKDFQLYTQYRTALIRAWELIAQLTEKQEKLKHTYDRAKRGKKSRSLVNASIGASSGVAPFALKDIQKSKMVSAIGGTVVATVGTLEATEVVGRSVRDLIDQLNKVIVKRNELQTKGDIFARKYNLRSSRRNLTQFARDLDDFESSMKVNDLLALELDASWTERNRPTDQRLQKTFKDYVPFEQ